METIFISSTFRDMYAERDVLLEKTIPALNAKAMAYGDAVSACDLRWGVDTTDLDEEIANRKVCDVCFDEIDRSTSPMVVLLGERYGWIPPESLVEDLATSRSMHLDDLQVSVTNLEIEYGAFTKRLNTLFYFREIVGDTPAGYGAEDELHEQKLRALKQRIAKAFPGNVKTFTVRYENGQPNKSDMDAFHRMVYGDVERILASRWRDEAAESPEEQAQRLEMQAHWQFAEMKGSSLCAKRDELEQAIRMIESGTRLLILKGREGAGKSTLFGALVLDLRDRGWKVIPVSCGLTQKSSDAESLMHLLVRRLEAELGEGHRGVAVAEDEDDLSYKKGYVEALRRRYVELCEKLVARGGRSIIMLDAVDQLAAGEARESFAFVPRGALADGLRFVMTCQPELDTRSLEVSQGLPSDQDAMVLFIDTLRESEKRKVIYGILERHRKSLAEPVIDLLVSQKGSDTPLYLSLMLQRLMIMDIHDFEAINDRGGSMDEINKYQIGLIEEAPDSLAQVSALLIEEVGRRFHPGFMRRALILMGLTRYGLRMGDLASLCADAWNYLDFAYVNLYLSDSFFHRLDGRIDFVHGCFRQGVDLLVSGNDEELHREILRHLGNLPSIDPIKRNEILYHAVKADARGFFDCYIDEVIEANDERWAQVTAECFHDICMASLEWVQSYISSYRYRREGTRLLDFFTARVIDCFAMEVSEALVLINLLETFAIVWKTDSGPSSYLQRQLVYMHLCKCLALLLTLGHGEYKHLCDYAVACARLTLRLLSEGRLSREETLSALYHVMRCLDYSGDKEFAAEGLSIYDQTLALGLYENIPDAFMADYLSLIAELHMRMPGDEQWQHFYEQAYHHGKRAYEEHGDLPAIETYAHVLRCYATRLLNSGIFPEARTHLEEAIKLYTTHQVELLETHDTVLFAWSDCYGRLAAADFVILYIQLKSPDGNGDYKQRERRLLEEILDATLNATSTGRRFARLFCDRSVDVSTNNDLASYLEKIASIDPSVLRRESNRLVRFFDEMLESDYKNAILYRNEFWESTFSETMETSVDALVTLAKAHVQGAAKLLKKWYGRIVGYFQAEVEALLGAGDLHAGLLRLSQEATILLLFDDRRATTEAVSALLRALELCSRVREVEGHDVNYVLVASIEQLAGSCFDRLENRPASYKHYTSAIYLLLENSSRRGLAAASHDFVEYANSALRYAAHLENEKELEEAGSVLAEALELAAVFDEVNNWELRQTLCEVSYEHVDVYCEMWKALGVGNRRLFSAEKRRQIEVVASKAEEAYERYLCHTRKLLSFETRIRELAKHTKVFANSGVTMNEIEAPIDGRLSGFTLGAAGGPTSVTEPTNAILEETLRLTAEYQLFNERFGPDGREMLAEPVLDICKRAMVLYEDVKHLYDHSGQSKLFDDAQESYRLIAEFSEFQRGVAEVEQEAPVRRTRWSEFVARTKENAKIARTLHETAGELYKLGYGTFKEIQERMISERYFTIAYYFERWITQRGIESRRPNASNKAAYRIALGTRYKINKKSLDEAFRVFRAAAGKGQTMAMANVAYCYEHGLGARRSKEKAVHWYKKALEHGNGWAAYRLSGMYLTGELVKRDYGEAIDYFMQAVGIEGVDPVLKLYNAEYLDDLHDMAGWLRGQAISGDAAAMYRLGFAYEVGYAVPRDSRLAKEWYGRAAARGEVNAMRAIGDGYRENGTRVRRDGKHQSDARALEWYGKAAAGGDAASMQRIGDMLSRGTRSNRKYDEACTWYERAIHLGCTDAYVGLGRLYQKGLGVKRDRQQARQCYEEAERVGNRDAKRALRRMDFARDAMYMALSFVLVVLVFAFFKWLELRDLQSFGNYEDAPIWTR